MNRPQRVVPVVLVLLVVAALPAKTMAGDWPHERDGVVLGFNVGGGSANLEVDNITGDRESGGAANIRVAYMAQPALAIGAESNLWSKEIEGVTWTFSVIAAALTFYPSGEGFFIRGGVGSGTISAELRDSGASVSVSDSGLGLLGALGYEWRLTRKFALGPELDFGWMDVGDEVTANYFNLTAALNWYL